MSVEKVEIISHLRGIFCFVYIVANLCFWLAPLIFLALLKLLVPSRRFQELMTLPMALLYRLAVWLDDFLLFHIMGIKLKVAGVRKEYPETFYLITANHQSWSDIFILQHLFNWNAPVLKFLVKKELIYLPLVGIICLAYDYPFLQRASLKGKKSSVGNFRKDTSVLEKTFEKFSRYPASVINLVEGTRFSTVKAKRQQSPYKHLLKPRAGGLAAIFSIFETKIHTVLDVTIVYDCMRPNFWDFLRGKCRRVMVEIKEYGPDGSGLPEGRDFDSIAKWINGVWEKKDDEIERIRRNF